MSLSAPQPTLRAIHMPRALRFSRLDYPKTIVMNLLLLSSACVVALSVAIERAPFDLSIQHAASVLVHGALAMMGGLTVGALVRQRARTLQTSMLITNAAAVPLALCAVTTQSWLLPYRAIALIAAAVITAAACLVNALTLCSVLRADARLALP